MLIAEIGFNHLGKYKIADQYLDVLLQSDVDAITFQIREPLHREKKPYRYFDDDKYQHLFKRIKDCNKKVGVALANPEYISFFEELNVDFYKVIRNDITNKNLLRMLIKTKKKIYVSTGMSSEEDIYMFNKFVGTQREQFSLIHTQLSNNIEDCNLKSIQAMKKYGMDVGYGSHCPDENTIFMALCCEPSDIFIYVKGDEDADYPDKYHAVAISKFPFLINKINDYKRAMGSGTKETMNNKIESLKKR